MEDLTVVLLPALAMGLGWGIRGQFGHETGAMVPGALVGLALAVVSSREPTTADALRLAAVSALACSLGGVMTYGQTLGLVHDKPNLPSRKWGLLGCAVKGGAWIGLTGAFIGVAGSGVPYTPTEIAGICLGCAVLAAVGIRTLNRPHRPPGNLPRVYFSKRDDPRPRPEFWGGLWMALAGLLLYLLLAKGDWFAVGMACWGMLGGAAGFTGGEWLQAWGNHRQPFGSRAQGWTDWWKVMEVSFGLIAGAALGLGWHLAEVRSTPFVAPEVTLPAAGEVLLAVVWMAWLVAAEAGWRPANAMWELSFVAIGLPMTCVFGGQLWPVFVVLPVLVWVGGDDVCRRWGHDERLLAPVWLWGGLAALTLGASAWAWSSAADGPAPSAWLALTAWVQTGFTVLWALGSGAVLRASGGRSRLLAMGSALTVEAVFVAMAAAITVLAWL